MGRHRLFALAVVLVGSLSAGWARVAFAQPLDEATLEAREGEAKRACDAGQVPDGVRALDELFRRTGDGTYMFNIGRCYQQNGQLDQALPHFRAYLQRPDVDPAAAARAREFIAAAESRPPAPVSATGPPSANPVPDLITVAPAPRGPEAPPGRALRIGGLVSGGVGVAALLTGAYYAQRVSELERENRQALSLGDKSADWADAQNRKGDRAERRQWLFLGVGGAAVIAGGVLYYLGIREEARAVPVALPGGGLGGALSGRF